MTPVDLLSVLRRRWPVLVLSVALLLAAAAGASRRSPSRAAEPPPLYSASAILLGTGTRGVGNLETLAALVTVGVIPERVAAGLDHESPAQVARVVRSASDTRTGLLTITATARRGRAAERIANAFARELISFVAEERQKELQAQMALLDTRRDELEAEIEALEERAANAKRKSAASEMRALIAQREREIAGIDSGKQQLSAASTYRTGGPELVQEARSVRLPPPPAANVGRSPAFFGAAGLVGLALGIALALILERLDVRIRSKATAEEYFTLPVLTEIPLLRRRSRRAAGTVVASDPTSLAADAHRLLALSLLPQDQRRAGRTHDDGRPVVDAGREASLVTSPAVAHRGDVAPAELPPLPRRGDALPGPGAAGGHAARTVLVTSPGRGDGKTSVAANLAMSYAEMGRKVVALSWDFQRPRLDAVFSIPKQDVTDAVVNNGNGRPGRRVVAATIEGLEIGVIPSRASQDRLEESRSSDGIERILAEAKDAGDVVIIDTAPLLDSSDAATLASRVDSVVVVARAGKTTAGQAERTRELLDRVAAPVHGVVLNRVKDMTIWTVTRRGRRSRR